MGKRRGALIAALAVGTGLPARAEIDISRHTTPRGLQYLYVSGEITSQSPQRLQRFISEQPHAPAVIVLDSPGGSLDGGIALGKLIRANAIRTMILEDGSCLSACSFAFIGGTERKVVEGGRLGMHQFRFNGSIDGAHAMETSQAYSGTLLSYFRTMGVDLEALERAMQTPSTQMYVFDPTELAAFRLVTPDRATESSASADCPFPKGLKISDPLGLYPACK